VIFVFFRGFFWNFLRFALESIMTRLARERMRTIQSEPSIVRDEELLRRVLSRDEDAFRELYRRRQAGIYRFALRMSGSEMIAEDVVQEAFMTLMREGARYDFEKGSVSAFLFGIARNHVLKRLERDRSLVQIDAHLESNDGLMPEQLIVDGDPLGDLTHNELINSVRQAVLALPARYREVMILCDLEEMSYIETAATLGCAVGTVRSRLHRARAMLTTRLREAAPAAAERGRTNQRISPAGCLV
jgi:RNA polymerase sigma-70 factor (ECF subfamily)